MVYAPVAQRRFHKVLSLITSRASTATEVDRVIGACHHGDIQRFGMMTVDIGVFIIFRWVHWDVSSINTSCGTGKACYVSEFSGYIKRLVRPSYELLLKAKYRRDNGMNDIPYCSCGDTMTRVH